MGSACTVDVESILPESMRATDVPGGCYLPCVGLDASRAFEMSWRLTVDARGLKCPMPVIKLSQAMLAAARGQAVELISTDRGSCSDVPAWSPTWATS